MKLLPRQPGHMRLLSRAALIMAAVPLMLLIFAIVKQHYVLAGVMAVSTGLFVRNFKSARHIATTIDRREARQTRP